MRTKYLPNTSMGELEYDKTSLAVKSGLAREECGGYCRVEKCATGLFAYFHERTVCNRAMVPVCVLLSENGVGRILECKGGRAKTMIRC